TSSQRIVMKATRSSGRSNRSFSITPISWISTLPRFWASAPPGSEVAFHSHCFRASAVAGIDDPGQCYDSRLKTGITDAGYNRLLAPLDAQPGAGYFKIIVWRSH